LRRRPPRRRERLPGPARVRVVQAELLLPARLHPAAGGRRQDSPSQFADRARPAALKAAWMPADHFDLIVIGSGTAAAACWGAAVQKGKRVAVFEADVLGGECPTFACMPTKALLHCAEVYEAAKGAGEFGIDIGSIAVDYRRVKAWKDRVVS